MKKIAITPLILLISMLIFSCGKEDPQDENITLSQTAIEIDYEESFKLDATFIRDGYSPSSFMWESANPKIAAVRNDGTVTAQRVGTTIVKVSTADRLFSADCEVTVNPTNFLYLEPLFDFGQTKAFIRENETRTLIEEDETSLLFRGENENIFGVVYIFEGTLYEGSLALLDIETEELENLIAYLEQRYELLGFSQNFLLFENENVIIGLTEEEGSFFVVYFENDESAGSGSRIDRLQKFSNHELMILRKKR